MGQNMTPKWAKDLMRHIQKCLGEFDVIVKFEDGPPIPMVSPEVRGFVIFTCPIANIEGGSIILPPCQKQLKNSARPYWYQLQYNKQGTVYTRPKLRETKLYGIISRWAPNIKH